MIMDCYVLISTRVTVAASVLLSVNGVGLCLVCGVVEIFVLKKVRRIILVCVMISVGVDIVILD